MPTAAPDEPDDGVVGLDEDDRAGGDVRHVALGVGGVHRVGAFGVRL